MIGPKPFHCAVTLHCPGSAKSTSVELQSVPYAVFPIPFASTGSKSTTARGLIFAAARVVASPPAECPSSPTRVASAFGTVRATSPTSASTIVPFFT